MIATTFDDITTVEIIMKSIVKKYDTIKLGEILESGDAPTDTGDEIEIDLFTTNPIDYDTKTKVDSQYISDCWNLKKELEQIFENKIEEGIDEENNWAFLYIIL